MDDQILIKRTYDWKCTRNLEMNTGGLAFKEGNVYTFEEATIIGETFLKDILHTDGKVFCTIDEMGQNHYMLEKDFEGYFQLLDINDES